ncbi:hypothetical protein [Helicobacter pylori]|uniref:hypothetical protein n=1 Tax=Helicobacter pylori TaxID=210 RepID=UPI0011CA14B3|nr:hypothetical protein [Helicobacter pylori]QEE97111.1 hypothetical protein D2C89_04175 [Helicobacter pylori]QEE98106.1 hypothetical protein D2C88_01365 [Helicobacter pylori]
MRQKHETATSFKELSKITQIMQARKTLTPKSENASASEPTQKSTPKPKGATHAKKGALKPTKRAFSERQNTAFRDHSQASANSSRETKASHNTNALKTEQAKNSSLRVKPSDEGLKQGLKNTQENQKGGKNEA